MAARAIHDQSERVVQVNRLELVRILQLNRTKHVADHEKAKVGYRKVLLSKIDKEFQDALKSIQRRYDETKTRVEMLSDADIEEQNDRIQVINAVVVEMKVPRCYAAEYDAAIDMAKWDVRETLELSHAEFQCFVRDMWEWTNEFTTISAMYMR